MQEPFDGLGVEDTFEVADQPLRGVFKATGWSSVISGEAADDGISVGVVSVGVVSVGVVWDVAPVGLGLVPGDGSRVIQHVKMSQQVRGHAHRHLQLGA